MKKSFLLLFCLSLLFWGFSSSIFAQQTSVGPQPKTFFLNPEQECTGTGELIYDDGTFENGYGWNAALVNVGMSVMLVTPAEYPWQFNTICIAFTQNATSYLDFDVVVYDDDGTGGAPGTLLGEVTGLSATGIPAWPTLAWYEFDISSLPALTDGSWYLGIRWNNVPAYPGTFVGADETPNPPAQPGYGWSDYDGLWNNYSSWYPNYHALGMRTLGAIAGPPCPVIAPTDPNPPDDAVDVDVNIGNLSWTNSAGTTANEVWFGPQGGMVQVYDGAPITSWPIATLDYLTDYQWKIRCKNDTCGANATWNFTTMQDPNLVTLFMDDFESGLGDYTINTTGGCPWALIPISSRGYTLPPAAQGNALAADADLCGSSGGGSSGTITLNTPIDATPYSTVSIEWDNDWQAINTSDFAYLDVSVDGGATWMNVVTFTDVDVRNTHEFYDISSLVANQTFIFRLVSVQPGWDWWWAVDNLQITGSGGNPPYVFSDNFDSYTAGQQLACQNPTDWTTWNLSPCDAVTDAYVSSNWSHSAPNSFVVVQNNDEVHYWGPETAGLWEIDFYNYIPSGKTGYFNTLGQFIAAQEWGLEVYFNAGGAGSLNAGGTGAASFTYLFDTWVLNKCVVDLDNDLAQYWYNGVMIYQWQWTLGSNGVPIALSLAANDFFGAAATDEMYVDDYTVNFIIPVELTSFQANANDGTVVLNWSTATETNNRGFEVQRSNGSDFVTLGFVSGYGTSTQSHNYSYVDNTVSSGKYSYRLNQVDFDGTNTYSKTVEVSVEIPSVFSLAQNYPNPFNPTTQIDFSLAVDSKVSLKIFDILGQEVSSIINGTLLAGPHTVTFNASNLTSGVYLYRIDATGADGSKFTNVKKMILTK